MGRGGVVDRVALQGAAADAAEGAGALVAAALQQFYEGPEPPREIDLPVNIEDADVTEAWLSSRAQRRVTLLVPQRGDRRRLVDLATRNAELAVRAAADPGGEAFAALDGCELIGIVEMKDRNPDGLSKGGEAGDK